MPLFIDKTLVCDGCNKKVDKDSVIVRNINAAYCFIEHECGAEIVYRRLHNAVKENVSRSYR